MLTAVRGHVASGAASVVLDGQMRQRREQQQVPGTQVTGLTASLACTFRLRLALRATRRVFGFLVLRDGAGGCLCEVCDGRGASIRPFRVLSRLMCEIAALCGSDIHRCMSNSHRCMSNSQWAESHVVQPGQGTAKPADRCSPSRNMWQTRFPAGNGRDHGNCRGAPGVVTRVALGAATGRAQVRDTPS
jgi:hypothetical protein